MIKLEFTDTITPLLNELALEFEKGFKRELRKAGEIIVDANVNRLKKGQALGGGRLKQLKPNTVQIKTKHGAAKPKVPLNYTGALLNAVKKSEIRVETDNKADQYVSVHLPDTMHHGSPHQDDKPMSVEDLVVLHHSGGKSSWGEDLPSRPFWGITKKTQNEILKYFRKRFQTRYGKKKGTVSIV